MGEATLAGGRRLVLAALAATTVISSGIGYAAARPSAAAHVARLATADPSGNIPPQPDFTGTCYRYGASSTICRNQALAAINHARRIDHVSKRMILPRNFPKLTMPEQTFVVVDLERVDRHLKPFLGMTAQLNRASQSAADSNTDPNLAFWTLGRMQIYRYGGIWAGDLGPLASVYDWMYNDGYSPSSGSINIDCAAPGGPGCWGHRQNILGTYDNMPTLVTGAAVSRQSQWISIAQLFTAGNGKPPAMTYTWKQALAHGADGHHPPKHKKHKKHAHRRKHRN